MRVTCYGHSWAIHPVLLLVLLLLGARSAQTQPRQTMSREDARTVLELHSASLTATSLAHTQLDSTLHLVSAAHRLSRIPAITEGFEDDFTTHYSSWINSSNPDSLFALLPGFSKMERTEAHLLLGAWYAFQPGAANYHKAIGILRQARKEAEQLARPDWAAQCACLLSKSYYMLTDTANGNKWYFTLINEPAYAPFAAIQAKARNYAGRYCPPLPQTNRFRLDCLHDALHRFQQLKDTGNTINTLMDIAYINFFAGDFTAAKEAATRSLLLQEQHHFPYTQYSNDLVSYIILYQGDHAAALPYALAALNATEATRDRLFTAHVYDRLSDCYALLRDKQKAIEWNEKALHAVDQSGKDVELYIVLNKLRAVEANPKWAQSTIQTIQDAMNRYPPANPVDSQIAYQALGNCYSSLGEYPKAKETYGMAWQLEPASHKIRGGRDNTFLLHRLGFVTRMMGEYTQSRNYFMQLLSPEYANETAQDNYHDAYENLYQVDSALGDYREAMQYLSLYSRLEEKLAGEHQSKQLLDLNVRYETLQREKQLQAMQAQSQLEKQQEASTRKLFYGGFLFLGFIIAMVYIRYYNNQRKNRQLRAQKEEIDQQNATLQQLTQKQTVLLEEKEWLLREIHHRVKNNLQVITSLLTSQSEFLKDAAAIQVMLESQHRVEAMSLIHQKLYNSADLSSIYMPEYIDELVTYLRDSFAMRQKVLLELDIEKLRLDVSRVVPLGLILNEAMTNAFKHAFPVDGDHRISIRLFSVADRVTLEIADNGCGLPPDYDLASRGSFGIILIKGMVEDLEGELSVDGTRGTSLSVQFFNNPDRN